MHDLPYAARTIRQAYAISADPKYPSGVDLLTGKKRFDKFHILFFSRLNPHLKSDRVTVMDLHPGTVLTHRGEAVVKRTADGDLLFDPEADIVKMAVIERHHETGNIGLALVRRYGMKRGAIALTVAHDSHNIIVIGTESGDMTAAVEELVRLGGGIVLTNGGAVLDELPLPVAGLMSDQPVEWVRDRLEALHEKAFDVLGVSREIDPIMTLCFMALPVIPELKLTDRGLFHVSELKFIPLEA